MSEGRPGEPAPEPARQREVRGAWPLAERAAAFPESGGGSATYCPPWLTLARESATRVRRQRRE